MECLGTSRRERFPDAQHTTLTFRTTLTRDMVTYLGLCQKKRPTSSGMFSTSPQKNKNKTNTNTPCHFSWLSFCTLDPHVIGTRSRSAHGACRPSSPSRRPAGAPTPRFGSPPKQPSGTRGGEGRGRGRSPVPTRTIGWKPMRSKMALESFT